MMLSQDMVITMLAACSAVFTLQFCTWMVSVRTNDVSIVDRIWGLTFIAGVFSAAATRGYWHAAVLVLLGLIAIWGLRLSVHIHIRNRGHGEDERYGAMREKNPRWFWLYSCVTVFFFQGLLSLVIGAPVYAAVLAAPPVEPWFLFPGAGLAAFGIIYEAVADWQLRRFKKKTRGEDDVLMTSGLWRLSRHPNYFGEIVVWWGLWLAAMSVDIPAWTVLSPVILTYLLARVTGVTLLESNMKKRKPGYEEYARSTPALIPDLRKLSSGEGQNDPEGA